MTEHAVVIAGGGPTGLMLAGELALAGTDVVVVERRANQDVDGSRAGGLHSRTAEQLDNRYIQANSSTSLAPIIHLTDPDGARAYLLRACALNDEMGNAHANSTTTMFLALHELRSGDAVAAARWARRSLELCVDVAPSYVAQTTNAIVAVVKRHSPSDAAVLLGALRVHRGRKHQAGTQAEIDAEARTKSRSAARSATSSTPCTRRAPRSTSPT